MLVVRLLVCLVVVHLFIAASTVCGDIIAVADRGIEAVSRFIPPAGELVGSSTTSTLIDNDIEDVSKGQGGNVFVADNSNERIVRFAPGDLQGVEVASSSTSPYFDQFMSAIDVDGSNTFYVADNTPSVNDPLGGRVSRFVPGDPMGTLFVDVDQDIVDIAVDFAGNLYMAFNSTEQIVRVAAGDTQGVVVASSATSPFFDNSIAGIDVDAAGTLYVADSTLETVSKFVIGDMFGMLVADSTTSTLIDHGIVDLTVDGAGNVYVAENANELIALFEPGDMMGEVFASSTTSVYFDNTIAGVDSRAVPEPSACVLLGLAGLVVLGVRRVRRWPACR